MIVDPDFPDHWKTRMLVDLLSGDEAAPVYLLRLWAHCQNRRAASFANLPPAAIKALCRFAGTADELEAALSASGFIRRDGCDLIVCGWEEYNASLIANWSNGKKGGRPKKDQKPVAKPQETHGFSMDNPSQSHGEPIREDRIREEKIGNTLPNPPVGREGGTEASSEDNRILPKGWERMSEKVQKQTKVLANSPSMIRIGSWFGRKEQTPWTVAEAASLKRILPIEEDIELLASYYEAVMPAERDYRRRDLQTLLNNWSGELDRARIWSIENSPKSQALEPLPWEKPRSWD